MKERPCEWVSEDKHGKRPCEYLARSTVAYRTMGRWRSFVTRRVVCGIHEQTALRHGWKIER